MCGSVWADRKDFLQDPEVELIGYQVNYKELAAGILLFNHSCHTTLAIYAEEFAGLYDGPVFSERATGSSECPGYCQNEEELRPCPAKCECAFVREIIHIIRRWPKVSQT